MKGRGRPAAIDRRQLRDCAHQLAYPTKEFSFSATAREKRPAKEWATITIAARATASTIRPTAARVVEGTRAAAAGRDPARA